MNELKHIGIELISMIWEIYWGLAFGFMLSSIIRSFIPASAIGSRLGKNNTKSLAFSFFLELSLPLVPTRYFKAQGFLRKIC